MPGKNRRFKKSLKQNFSIARLMPNIVTLAALCSGLSAIRFALQDKWELAVIAILVAGVLDALDGKVARFLGQSSHFGGELDSLSDMVSFGVVPAIVLYLRILEVLGNIGWIIALFYVVCMALRLARFNTLNLVSQKKIPELWEQKFFTGVPAPTAAFLLLLPIYISISISSDFRFHPVIVFLYVALVASLCVSRLPTFSIKGYTVSPKWVLPLLLTVGIFAASLISMPWITLSVVCGIYFVSIFFSCKAHAKLLKKSSGNYSKLKRRSNDKNNKNL